VLYIKGAYRNDMRRRKGSSLSEGSFLMPVFTGETYGKEIYTHALYASDISLR